MRRIDHPLPGQSLGHHTQLSSLHFGTPGARPKVYIQASLHAEELPGMLAAFHLRRMLEEAEAAGRIQGEIVLVPVANPIGLAQRLDHKPMGRFEFHSNENFNRHYPDLAEAVWPALQGRLGDSATHNVALVREAIAHWLAAWKPATALQGQRKTLVQLAFDADVVLDLHCDCEAVVHLYTEEPCWSTIAPLAQLLQARAALLARNSGGLSFDECLSGAWWQLQDRLAKAAQATASAPPPLPQSCHSTTVELRGETDVRHALGESDAAALFAYLQHLQVVAGPTPALPAPSCDPTPLAGSQTVRAPAAGMLVFVAQPGDLLHVGDPVVEIIDPVENTVVVVRAEVEGVLYATTFDRYALPNDDLANIAGRIPFRTGNLLGA